jgi:nucleoside-diphosphate-sugar epimerase
MTADTVLLTGATGLLGRYLVRDLSARGLPVAVLVRGDRRREAADRVAALTADAAEPRPRLIEGDLTAPGLGLSAADRRWIGRHCQQVVHGAASLTFAGSDRTGDPWRTNAAGTAAVVALARDAGVQSFHHVSTAYVCGRRADAVGEDDPLPAGGFRNDYEASKAEAERHARGAGFPVPVTVFRPAVIVGDSRTGYTSTYHGLYPYLYSIWAMGRRATRGAGGRWTLPLRLNLTGDEHRNLVPVDWVSAVLADVVAAPRLHGRTYHLAPDRPVSTRELERATADAFGYTGVTFVGPGPLAGGPTPIEARFYDRVVRYAPYWEADPRFLTAHTRAAAPDRPCPRVDGPMLRRLIDFAVRDEWGAKTRRAGTTGVPAVT